MNKDTVARYAIIAVLAAAVLIWAGLPPSTLLFGLVVLACPLMMIFMMRDGGHGGGTGHGGDRSHSDRDEHTR